MDKSANLPRRHNSIKVKRTSEALKANIAIPGNMRNEKKDLLIGKKSFCKEAEIFFPSGKKQLFALKLSKSNQFKHLQFGRLIATTTHRLQCV